jgi:hypothetical protein
MSLNTSYSVEDGLLVWGARASMLFRRCAVKQIVAESFLFLLWIECVMAFRSLESLLRQVRDAAPGIGGTDQLPGIEELCSSMDFACVMYPKCVLCLQRSAATALLLRRHGFNAQMIIGAQVLPPRSHAWVEVDGRVVNDKPYVQEIYQVLERC